MKLFAAFTSIFCIYFFYGVEAKADTYQNTQSAIYQQIGHSSETASITSFYNFKGNPEFNNCFPWAGAIPTGIQFVVVKKPPFETSKFVPALTSRELYVHTGLSPPHFLFA